MPAASNCSTRAGKAVTRKVQETQGVATDFGKGNFPHFMLKEIYEQPAVIGDCLRGFLAPDTGAITLPESAVRSRHACRAPPSSPAALRSTPGLVARYWLERLARIAVDIDVASEFRYRDAPMVAGGLAIFISQSGETADTLAAMRHAKTRGQHTLAVVNVAESSMAREADAVLLTHAGPEIGVASTKAFTTQMTVLAALTLAMARARKTIDAATEAQLSAAIAEVPALAAEVLNHDAAIQNACRRDRRCQHRALSRARHRFSHCAGRRAQAQGAVLYPRRGLRRRRDEAWPHRLDRQERCRSSSSRRRTAFSTRRRRTCRRSSRAAAG